jgi:hypothetical protein
LNTATGHACQKEHLAGVIVPEWRYVDRGPAIQWAFQIGLHWAGVPLPPAAKKLIGLARLKGELWPPQNLAEESKAGGWVEPGERG